jgi:hypothetical protein
MAWNNQAMPTKPKNRTEVEERFVEAAEDVLREANTEAAVLPMSEEGDKVAAVGNTDALTAIIPAAAGKPPTELHQISAAEQEAFIENTPADLRDQVRRRLQRQT